MDVEPYDSRTCPSCESASANLSAEYSHEDWKIVECGQCSLTFLANPPGYFSLNENFSWEKTYAQEKKRRLKSRRISAPLSERTRWRTTIFSGNTERIQKLFPTGNILDIGCGSGDLAMCLHKDAVPFGVEISKKLHEISNERLSSRGGKVIHAAATEGIKEYESDFFDGVIMNSYLEHEEHPRKILAGLNRVLKSGGKIYIRVPNFGGLNRKFMGKKWCGFRYPDHLSYFTLADLKSLANDFGFDVRLLNKLKLQVDDNIKILFIKQ